MLEYPRSNQFVLHEDVSYKPREELLVKLEIGTRNQLEHSPILCWCCAGGP